MVTNLIGNKRDIFNVNFFVSHLIDMHVNLDKVSNKREKNKHLINLVSKLCLFL